MSEQAQQQAEEEALDNRLRKYYGTSIEQLIDQVVNGLEPDMDQEIRYVFSSHSIDQDDKFRDQVRAVVEEKAADILKAEEHARREARREEQY